MEYGDIFMRILGLDIGDKTIGVAVSDGAAESAEVVVVIADVLTDVGVGVAAGADSEVIEISKVWLLENQFVRTHRNSSATSASADAILRCAGARALPRAAQSVGAVDRTGRERVGLRPSTSP